MLLESECSINMKATRVTQARKASKCSILLKLARASCCKQSKASIGRKCLAVLNNKKAMRRKSNNSLSLIPLKTPMGKYERFLLIYLLRNLIGEMEGVTAPLKANCQTL